MYTEEKVELSADDQRLFADWRMQGYATWRSAKSKMAQVWHAWCAFERMPYVAVQVGAKHARIDVDTFVSGVPLSLEARMKIRAAIDAVGKPAKVMRDAPWHIAATQVPLDRADELAAVFVEAVGIVALERSGKKLAA